MNDDNPLILQLEQNFISLASSIVEKHRAYTKSQAVGKILFFTYRQSKATLKFQQHGSKNQIHLDVTYDKGGDTKTAELNWHEGGDQFQLAAGLLDPPALAIFKNEEESGIVEKEDNPEYQMATGILKNGLPQPQG